MCAPDVSHTFRTLPLGCLPPALHPPTTNPQHTRVPLPLPQQFSLRAIWEYAPAVGFYAFGMSFLAVSLAIGIFAPRRQMPTDIFAVGGGAGRKDIRSGVG